MSNDVQELPVDRLLTEEELDKAIEWAHNNAISLGMLSLWLQSTPQVNVDKDKLIIVLDSLTALLAVMCDITIDDLDEEIAEIGLNKDGTPSANMLNAVASTIGEQSFVEGTTVLRQPSAGAFFIHEEGHT